MLTFKKICDWCFFVICVMISFVTLSLKAQDQLYFNIDSLNLSEAERSRIDLSLLSSIDNQMPGEYDVHVWLNNQRVGDFTLNFITCDANLCAQLTAGILKSLGVKVSAISALSGLAPEDVISDISKVIPGALSQFDFSQSKLNISIPQAALDNQARGYIPPEKWEHGLPMVFTSYSASGSESRQGKTGENVSTQFINLRSGANYDQWRLRNESYYSPSDGNGYQWKSMQTWLERDINALSSRVRVGEGMSGGMLFNTFSYRGMSLASQDEMLPDSMIGFAPEVRGVAITNATVEIRQNGNLLYETFVSPGQFVINDLYAVSTSGDLEVTIREDNGEVRTYVQPFAAPPVSVRKGALKYTVSGGEFGSSYYQQQHAVQQTFVQTELLYGVFNSSSLYGGLIAAEHYRAGMVGVGQGLGQWGALSLDATQADTSFSDGSKQQGQSWRMRYSKRFDNTKTNMTLAGYRYATDGYYDFDAASNNYYNSDRVASYTLKSKSQLTLSQYMGDFGSIAVSAGQSEYWGANQSKNRTIIGNWSRRFGAATVSLAQSADKNWNSGNTNHVTSVNISLPIGKWLSPSGHDSLLLSNSVTYAGNGSTAFNSTISGSALENSNLNYALTQVHSTNRDTKDTNSTSLSATYKGGSTTASLGYSDLYGDSSRLNWGLRGSVVVHPYGVTLSQSLNEGSSYALVRAPDAGGVKVKNRIGLTTDSRGYAVVPSLKPYRENTIVIDTATLPDDIDVTNAIKHTVPTREALVLTDFETHIGYRVFLTLTRGGVPLPMGVMVKAGENSGLTNEKGQIFLTGIPDKVKMQATLADGNVCQILFDSATANKSNGILISNFECT
ncbi:MAG: fimbria/pilus outer membrane usher protein [Aeromonas popoffii]|uniref:fimbria/pilus outer membrane usher protein n=1 Tax=Aeromonas popoffii TaxID=70856 RepID=UPI003F36EF03